MRVENAPAVIDVTGDALGTGLPRTESFEDVFAREYDGMVRLAYLMVGTSAGAEDVVQEAFARLLGRWDRVDNPGAYVRTAVVNGARDKLRGRLLRRRPHPTRSRGDYVTDELDYLGDALATLPHQWRAVVVLRFFEQRTVPEIAELLNMKQGTVKSALHRGLLRLREVIER